MKRNILFFIGALWMLSGCKPDDTKPEPIKPYDQRDQFVGVYSVKHDSGYTYVMQVSKFDSAGRWYLKVNNFANLFPSIITDVYQKNVINTPLNFFNLGFNFGIKDKLGHTWDFSNYNDDTTTTERENVLANNQIILYFRLQNMPWWSAEGVPYHFAEHKHVGTKIW